MAKATRGELAHLVCSGLEIAVQVTPNASRNSVTECPNGLLIRTTATPEGGKATADVISQLARALGLPKSRLTLVRGATARDKVFRID